MDGMDESMTDCPHDSLSGDEGPVAELGRMPVRWRCDECDTIVYDDVNRYASAAAPERIEVFGHYEAPENFA
jgi:hypothetical protein